ncbi:hypothetical protein CHS0354_032777 [Potamilus streckersoni]|uniref:Uncharacterized protein n=1 Tax=Potamilus streckersoni TaxID=2493646 RepID=A0AAE0SYT0_9BIVA|nr:hypothetical protein CHS0354_032777 [Potamilus streckersoni]
MLANKQVTEDRSSKNKNRNKKTNRNNRQCKIPSKKYNENKAIYQTNRATTATKYQTVYADTKTSSTTRRATIKGPIQQQGADETITLGRKKNNKKTKNESEKKKESEQKVLPTEIR